jgi:NAD(P)-dependent dehydrogenase (short-subunit alcohol dehydrogenase family)
MPRVALITAARRGIGAATAWVFTQDGFRVVVNYRSSATEADVGRRAIDAVATELGVASISADTFYASAQ